MKKFFALVLSLAMTICLFAGCNSTSNPSGDTSTSTGTEAQTGSGTETGFSNVKAVSLKLATIYAADHPFSTGLDTFCKAVYEKSDGKLEIQHFPAAQLGDEPSIHEGLKNKTIDMAVMGISEAGKDYSPVLVFDAPFLFTDAEQMLAADKSELGQKLWADFEKETGITMLSPIYYGTRQLTTNKKVTILGDLKGMKIRVPSQQNSVDVWTALGAVATPMNLSEVYLSLQTGVVDGQENPLATIVSQGFDEVCSFLNMTSHSVQSCPLFISSDVYNNLDPALKEVLDACVAEYISTISQNVIDYEKKMIEEIKSGGGMTVNGDVDRDSFRNALADYIAKNESTWGEGVYDTLAATK